MRQICLLMAMSVMSSVSGETCESAWDEIIALRDREVNVDVVRRQAPAAGGQVASHDDGLKNARHDDDDDSGELNKILGGSFTRQGEFPWQVGIFVDAEHVCGGVILNDYWVLTAASCVHNVTSAIMQVKLVVGSYQLDIIDRYSSQLSPEKIFIHRHYNPRAGFDYDIALMKVCTNYSITFNRNTRPISLPQPGAVIPIGTQLKFSGWGRQNPSTNNRGQSLKKVMLPVISNTVCNRDVYPGYITDRMLCAGKVNGNTDACFADTGGPAVYQSGGRYVLAGIMVGGTGCQLQNYPVIFSRVSAYRTWIDEVMARDDNLGQLEIAWV